MANGYKTGGRKKGTPNKPTSPLKASLREHSTAYFEKKPQVGADGKPRKLQVLSSGGAVVSETVLADASGFPLVMSDFEVDLMQMEASERVTSMIRILEFHTPKMKAVDVDLDARVSNKTIEDMLSELCLEGEDDE